ncbi:MAG TPA: hypothetical protein VLG39_11170 [Nitrospirota bacterium]|nr:hypothetical protein [Nitrospirota bacterium]
MNTYNRHRVILLSVCILLFYILQSGCSQGNKSKIVGSWRISLQINKAAPTTILTSWTFDKGGNVKVDSKIVINNKEEMNSTMTGKYKFKDENTISYSFDDKNMLIKKVSFPDPNTMLFGEEKMERIK